MLNYVKSELYRTLHRKYFYILLLSCGALCFGVNFLLLWMEMQTDGVVNGADAAFSLTMVGGMLFSVSYVCPLIITDLVFSEEYKHATMKNTVSYGFTRLEIFFGKFLAELAVAVAAVVFILGVFFASAFLLGVSDRQETAQAVRLFLERALLMLPLWLWALALSHTVAFFVRNNTFFAFVTVGVLYIVPLVFVQYMVYPWPDLVAAVAPYLAFTKMQELSSMHFSVGNLGLAALDYWGTGLVRAAAALAAGAALFRKHEIK